MTGLRHDPRKLCNAYFSLAKGWWGAALFFKACVILVSAVVIWFSILSKASPFLALSLALASEWFAWRSDRAKSIAETLLRKLDYRDALGWEISRAELSDVLARSSGKLRRRIPPEDHGENYFASSESVGPVRALQNLQESAWWSKHLAEKTGRYTLAGTTVATLGSLLILVTTVGTLQNFEVLASVGRVVTAVLMFAVSLGLVRLTLGYYDFGQRAHRTEQRATEFLRGGCTEIDAIKLYNDYHLDRAVAPLVPDRVWKWTRDQLNELWDNYRAT
jgi:hypothetical protein